MLIDKRSLHEKVAKFNAHKARKDDKRKEKQN